MQNYSLNLAQLPTQSLTDAIIRCAITVHSHLGPGLLESTYEVCLEDELLKNRIHVDRQIILPVKYQEKTLDAGYRIDLLVENEILIEIKSVESLLPIHQAQLMTYLKLSQKTVGLLMNFNVLLLKDGLKRILRKPPFSP